MHLDQVAGPSPAPGVRVTRRRGQTRRRMLDAALQAFAELGFGRTRIEDVVQRAGYTRGAFYSNFASLDELFFALYADRAEQVVAAARSGLRAATSTGRPPVAGALSTASVVEHVLAVFPRDRQWFLVHSEFTAHALRHPEVAATLAEQRRDLRRALAQVLGPATGETSAPALDRLARAVIAVTEGMLAQELLEPEDPSLPALHRRLLLSAVTALDGQHRA